MDAGHALYALGDVVQDLTDDWRVLRQDPVLFQLRPLHFQQGNDDLQVVFDPVMALLQ